MPKDELLANFVAGFEYLSLIDRYSGYNQIFFIEEDVAKTVFRCPRSLGTYERVVIPFGIKNVYATY